VRLVSPVINQGVIRSQMGVPVNPRFEPLSLIGVRINLLVLNIEVTERCCLEDRCIGIRN